MKMMIKAFANSPISLLTLTSTATTGSHIELGGTAGTINLVFAGADTAAIQPIGPPMQNPLALDIPVYKIGVYDLYFVDATGKGGYLIQGSVTLEQQVTTP